MADEHESVIPIESDADVVIARQRARAMASELELTSTDQTLLATAISEVPNPRLISKVFLAVNGPGAL